MTLPAGLATIAARLDDAPNTRGALAFCRAFSDRQDAQARTDAIPKGVIDRHAALVVREAYRSRDMRAIVFRQGGVEVVR